MSGKCQGKTKFSSGQRKVREFWPFDPCQVIVREFCHVMSGNSAWYFFRLKIPSYDNVMWLCICLLGNYKLKVYWLLLLDCGGIALYFKNLTFFLTLKNKRNCQGKMLICQGILDQLKCGNPVKWTSMVNNPETGEEMTTANPSVKIIPKIWHMRSCWSVYGMERKQLLLFARQIFPFQFRLILILQDRKVACCFTLKWRKWEFSIFCLLLNPCLFITTD